MLHKDRLWLISNFNFDPSEVLYRIPDPYIIFNQGSESILPNKLKLPGSFIQSRHTGHNLSDYLEYIIKNFKNLPDSLGFAKGNIFPRHMAEQVFIDRQKQDGFVPLYSDISTFDPSYHWLLKFLVAQQTAPGYFLERTNNWYTRTNKIGKFYPKINDMFEFFFKRAAPRYITFVPGACMIVPSVNIVRWPIDVYEKLYEAVTYEFFPVESYHLERCMLYFFSFPKV
jgi:hypothetical protein